MSQHTDHLKDSAELRRLVDYAKHLTPSCEDRPTYTNHELQCFVIIDPGQVARSDSSAETDETYETTRCVPKCWRALLRVIIHVIANKPLLVDDMVMQKIIEYFNFKDKKMLGLITLENLQILYQQSQTQSSLATWLRYENFLSKMISAGIYEPEALADELLVLARSEIDRNLMAKIASCVESCVKQCRDVNKRKQSNLEEKWVEIIEWMTWFLRTQYEDM